MTTLLVVRHADVHNPGDVIYGRLPRFRLSHLGQEQAKRLAEFLADQPISAIYSSPQLRARQTAQHIAAHRPGVTVRISSLLAEIMTSWQGTPNSIAGPNLNFFAERRAERDETLEQIAHRIRRFLRLVLRRHPEQTVVAVSHGDPILILQLLVAGREPTFASMREGRYPAKASVMKVELPRLDQEATVEYWEAPVAPTPLKV